MGDEDMLRGLDAVDWGSLSHAFGPAENVPELLGKLISEDADTRWEAYDELTNTVWHQGTVYSVSAHVVPFLTAMLRSPDTPDKRLPALLLALLADGSSFLEVHATSDSPAAEGIRAWLAKEGRDLQAELAQERDWVEETCLATGEAVLLLLLFLSDDEAEVRYVVALALARYPERAGELLPVLGPALRREAEEHVHEAIEGAIAALRGAGSQQARWGVTRRERGGSEQGKDLPPTAAADGGLGIIPAGRVTIARPTRQPRAGAGGG